MRLDRSPMPALSGDLRLETAFSRTVNDLSNMCSGVRIWSMRERRYGAAFTATCPMESAMTSRNDVAGGSR